MFPPPVGRDLSPDQIQELDDAFFGSDPRGYFLARIRALIAYADGAEVDYSAGLGAEFSSKLRWLRDDDVLAHSADARETQVAVDAMSLRQHLAEGVARLWLTLMRTRTVAPGDVSIWATLSKTPVSNLKVFEDIENCDGWDDWKAHLDLILPPELHAAVRDGGPVCKAVDVVHQWLNRAADLLTRSDIHIAAANNKYKHGFAVRAHLDRRISFLPVDAIPSSGPTVPLSAAAKEIPLFDTPTIDYLSEPNDEEGKHGLELTRMGLDAASLLVESTMLATIYGCLFHVAAARYNAWSDSIREIAPYPSLPLGPTPAELLGASVLGMRHPVTYRPDGSPPTRGHLIGLNDGTHIGLTVDHAGRRKVKFVDDESHEQHKPSQPDA